MCVCVLHGYISIIIHAIFQIDTCPRAGGQPRLFGGPAGSCVCGYHEVSDFKKFPPMMLMLLAVS